MNKILIIIFLFTITSNFSQIDEKLYTNNWGDIEIEDNYMKFVKYEDDKMNGTISFTRDNKIIINLRSCWTLKKRSNITYYWKIKNDSTLILSREKIFTNSKDWLIKKITNKKLHLELISN